jgi:SAM-dependent methyltransferase
LNSLDEINGNGAFEALSFDMDGREHLEYARALEDDRFDLIYPQEIRQLSSRHWTPVKVGRQAAAFLVTGPATKVLDIGCGPGKFCIVGAVSTSGQFTGVEQRPKLCACARAAIQQAGIANAAIIHGNVAELDFAAFDAFYLFNPFEENLFRFGKIDASVELNSALYEKYIEHVATQLAMAPLGTRVATYCGACEEVPMGYECKESLFGHSLKLWEKTILHPVRKPRPPDDSAEMKRWRQVFEDVLPD